MTTEKTTYTPGPWTWRKASPVGGPDHYAVDSGDDLGICVILDRPDDFANARLIAAAPALLEALVGLVETIDDMRDRNVFAPADDPDLTGAHAAIAAATEGDQP